ncbi:hypothetical protein EDD85DRAFT_795388 [Armillaria nabsnona]|nr:hypothetical protein EDD85DRAFT_795388 [Armillaria nabsnona]
MFDRSKVEARLDIVVTYRRVCGRNGNPSQTGRGELGEARELVASLSRLRLWSNPPPDLRHNRFETLDCVVMNYGAGRTCNNSPRHRSGLNARGNDDQHTKHTKTRRRAKNMADRAGGHSCRRKDDELEASDAAFDRILSESNHTTQVTEDQAKYIVSKIRNLEGGCSRSIPRNVEHLVIDGENLQLEANATCIRRCLNHRDCVEGVVKGASISYSFKSLCERSDKRITELHVVNQLAMEEFEM